MKSFSTLRYGVFTLALVVALAGCKKNAEAPGLSAKIQNIVPTAVLTDLKDKGLVVNEGNTPPHVEGIFRVSPMKLLAPYGQDDGYKKDRVIGDYHFRFSGQNGDDVKLDYKQTSASLVEASGVTSFLAGSGTRFTLFGELTGSYSGIANKKLAVISGEVTPTGIKDFQYAFVITDKTGDSGNSILIPVGKARVWIDGNAVASKVSAFRMATEEIRPSPSHTADSVPE